MLEWIQANPELSIAAFGALYGIGSVLIGKYVPIAYKGFVLKFFEAVKVHLEKKTKT